MDEPAVPAAGSRRVERLAITAFPVTFVRTRLRCRNANAAGNNRNGDRMIRVLFILGTRPEAIKMAPIILAAREDRAIEPIVCLTGQHPQIATEALSVFDIEPDCILECAPSGGDLCIAAAEMIRAAGELIAERQPSVVLVQGDTLSAYAGGMAAALRRVPVGHVEAGLRSGDMNDPFPEELARKQLAHLSQMHFAPTMRAAQNLIAENIDRETVHLVGNTVIDAMRLVQSRKGDTTNQAFTVLVTAHRRENWGDRMDQICAAVAELADRQPSWRFVFSLHPNPALQQQVRRALSACDSVEFVESPAYDDWVRRLVGCDLILTDSGGIQEEACALGRPTLILRDVTERPEAVHAGSAIIVGSDRERIVFEAIRIANDARVYERMSRPRKVFGDGFAAECIINIIKTSVGTEVGQATGAGDAAMLDSIASSI